MSSQDRKTEDPRGVELFQAKYGLVLRVAFRFAPDPGLIHDVAQQVFCEFLQHAETRHWDIAGEVDGLLYTITRNVCSNLWRERRRETPEALRRIGEYLLQLNGRQVEEDGPEENVDEYRAMRQCLDRLPEKSRHVVKMRYFLEMPTGEIAEQLNIEPDSVRKTVARIRLRLRKCIEKTLQSVTATK